MTRITGAATMERAKELSPKRREAEKLLLDYSIGEVADALGVNWHTVRRWKSKLKLGSGGGVKGRRPSLTGAAAWQRALELTGKRREGFEYFRANPHATGSEVAKLLDVPRTTAGGWKRRSLKCKGDRQARQATQAQAKPARYLGRAIEVTEPKRIGITAVQSPTSLKGEVLKLRDELRGLLGLAEEALPAIEILEALERAMTKVGNLEIRVQNITAQRNVLQSKLLERSCAMPGD